MKSRGDLLNEARLQIPEVSVRGVRDRLEAGDRPVLLDVRGVDEWELGHLQGAVHIPRGHLEVEVESRLPDKSEEVLVYCAAGIRSLLAGRTLRELGYERVLSVAGGFSGWADAGLPVDRPPAPEEEDEPGDPGLLETEIEHLERVLARKRALLERTRNGR